MADFTTQSQEVISRSLTTNEEIQQLSDSGENFIGVWLDENSEKIDHEIYVDLKRDLDRSFDFLYPFTKAWECFRYLDSIKNGKILFIVSHKHACDIMTIIEGANLSQIHLIYIVCSNESEKDSWDSKNFKKLRGSFVSKDELMKQLKDDINTIHIDTEASEISTASSSTQDTINERTENAIPQISVFSSEPKNNSIKHLNKDSIWFIRYQLLFELLLKLEKSAMAVEEMIYVCENLCDDSKQTKAQIEEFKKDAKDAFEKDAKDAFDSIYWYTKASFIVHVLNRACGSQKFNDIYPFRFFISDLHNELVELDKNRRSNILEGTITVFRGKYVALSTLEKLKKNKNGLVAMNGFLSTSRKHTVASFFAGEGILKTGQMAVLFKLNIDPKVVNKPYADIPPDRHAMGPEEEELLFSVGSVWQIIDVNELIDNQNPDKKMWCVELTLSNKDDEQSKKLDNYLKSEIGEKFSNWTLGDFLTKTKEYEQAETYYHILKLTLPKTEANSAIIYNRIAHVRYENKDYATALVYLQKAMEHAEKDSEVPALIEFNKKTIEADTSVAARCASALRRQLKNYDVVTKYLLSNPASVPIIQNNFGCVYHQQGVLDHALECYDNALQVLLKSESSFYPEISAIYNNIGAVQLSKANYIGAEKNFRLAITTLSNVKLDSPHPWIREYTENFKAVRGYKDSNKPKRLKTE